MTGERQSRHSGSMAWELHSATRVRIKTVQLALRDHDYATAICNLLTEDRLRRVFIAGFPDPAIEGIIFIDSFRLYELPLLTQQPERLVVMVQKDLDDLSKIWDAGVRHVIFHGDPPQTACAMVLGLEWALGANGAA